MDIAGDIAGSFAGPAAKSAIEGAGTAVDQTRTRTGDRTGDTTTSGDTSTPSGGTLSPGDLPSYSGPSRSDRSGRGSGEGWSRDSTSRDRAGSADDSVDPRDLDPSTEARVTQTAAEQRREMADTIESRTGAEVNPWDLGTDVTRTDRGLQIASTVPESVRRDILATRAESNLEQQLGVYRTGTPRRGRLSREYMGAVESQTPDLQRGEDYTVSLRNDSARLTPEFRKEQAAAQTPGASPEDFEVTASGEVRPTEGFVEEQAAEKVKSQLGMPGWERGSEFTVDVGRVSQNQAAMAGLAGTVASGVMPGGRATKSAITSQFQPGQRYTDVELTPQGRRFLTKDRVAEQGQVMGTKVTDLDQLQFNEQGRLTGVEAPDLGWAEGWVAEAEAGTSPLPSMAVPRSQRDTFVEAEQQIIDLAERSDPAAIAYTSGEMTQEIGKDVEGAVEYVSPLDRIPYIGKGVEGGLGAIAGAPWVLGGGAVQAGSAPFVGSRVEGTGDGVVGQFATGVETGAINTAEYAVSNPVEAATFLAFPYATRATTRAIRARRSGASEAETIPFEELTTEQGAKGGFPEFSTRRSEPTSRAVSETRARAADQPETVTEATGSDSLLYHTTGERLGEPTGAGRRLTVGEGSSELPGLYAAPDVNPVGLRGTPLQTASQLAAGLKPSMPRLSADRIAAFRDPSIRAMPEWAKGSGYELRGPSGDVVARGLSRPEAKFRAEGTDLTVRPQSNTPGYRYLTEDAEPGTGYVRPRGSRTPEAEAIFPPESEFVQTGATPPLAARIGGREISIPFTQRSFTLGGERVPIDVFTEAQASGSRVASEVASQAGRTAAEIGGQYRSPTEVVASQRGTPAEGYIAGASGTARAAESMTRQESAVDQEYVDPDYTSGDKDLPYDWRRKTSEELEQTQRRMEEEYYRRDSRPSEYGGWYSDYTQSINQVDRSVAETTSRITSGSSPITSGTGTTTGERRVSEAPSRADSRVSEPSYAEPPGYEPPRYPVSPPTSPSVNPTIPEPTSPYQYTPTPGATPPWDPERYPRYRDEDEEDYLDNQPVMGLFAHDWVNPVVDAQEAIGDVLGMDRMGGGQFDPLGAVQEDLENLY